MQVSFAPNRLQKAPLRAGDNHVARPLLSLRGAHVVLAETVGSIAAAIAAGEGRAAMGLDINSTHHRGVRSGFVTATATALSEGRSVAAYEIAIVDDEGRRVNTSRLTCILRDAPTRAS